MVCDWQQGSAIRFEGAFDEQAFRNYVRLFMRPHEWEAGWWFIIACSIMLFLYVLILGIIFSSDDQIVWLQVLFILLGFVCVRYILLGVTMVAGIRRPMWGTKRWSAKTRVVFERLHSCDMENPLGYNVPDRLASSDEWPFFFWNYSLFYLPFGDAFIFNDRFNAPLAYDWIPGLFPRYKNVPQNVKLEVSFSGAFLPDRILKGSHDRVFADSYADVHDVVEDQRRYPGLAIIRHQNAYSQLVVFTDKLEGGTWDDVKRRILAASPKALPRKERRRLSAEAGVQRA